MKYREGDRVVVRPDICIDKPYAMEDSGYRVYAASAMRRYAGKELVIEDTSDGYYRMKGVGWLWTDEMFLPAPEYDLDDSPFDLSDLIEV